MIKITRENDTQNEECILNKYIQKRHKLLLFLRNEEDVGNNTTVLEIIDKFQITKETAWKKLRRLEKMGDIKKAKKIKINGNEYFNFIITDKVRQELRVLSRNLYENYFPSPFTEKLDCIGGDDIKNLKERVKKVLQEFLPEDNRSTTLIQTVTAEINGFFMESET